MNTSEQLGPSDALEKQIQELRRFRRLGSRSLRRRPHHRPGAAKEAKALKINEEKLGIARRFAKEFEDEEFEQFENSIRRYRAPFCTSHLGRAMSVPKEERRAFIQKAIKQRWSVRVLNVQIEARYGKGKKRGGRKPKLIGGKPEILARIQSKCLMGLVSPNICIQSEATSSLETFRDYSNG